jgi:hypothetical protein
MLLYRDKSVKNLFNLFKQCPLAQKEKVHDFID